jgi:pimeloyl-ACP methyl ester carboxylesterase
MPKITANNTELHYEENGQGEILLFSHGLLYYNEMWERQIPEFEQSYRCIRYDHRGQGSSPRNGFPDMDTLCEDAADLIRKLDVGPVNFVGLSMGGFVGQRLAARYPELVKKLVLLDTSARAEKHKLRYSALSLVVKLFGIQPVLGRASKIMFGPAFRSEEEFKTDRDRWMKWLAGLPVEVTEAVKGVIDRPAIVDEISSIQAPSLVISGEHDVATPAWMGKEVASKIPGAEFHEIPNCGHMSAIERPKRVNDLIGDFLSRS